MCVQCRPGVQYTIMLSGNQRPPYANRGTAFPTPDPGAPSGASTSVGPGTSMMKAWAGDSNPQMENGWSVSQPYYTEFQNLKHVMGGFSLVMLEPDVSQCAGFLGIFPRHLVPNGVTKFQWDSIYFNEGVLHPRAPESGSRLLTSRYSSKSGSLKSFGRSVMVERGFSQSPVGMQIFAAQLRQIARAMFQTMSMQISRSIVDAAVPQSDGGQRGGRLSLSSFHKKVEAEVARFACYAKGPRDHLIVIQELQRVLGSRSQSSPDTLVLPKGLRRIVSSGVDRGQSAEGFGDFKLVDSCSYNLGPGTTPIDPFFQTRAYGEFVMASSHHTNGAPPETFSNVMRGVYTFHEQNDEPYFHSLKDLFDHSGLVDPHTGVFTHIGKALMGPGTLKDYLQSCGALDSVVESILHGIGAIGPAPHVAPRQKSARRKVRSPSPMGRAPSPMVSPPKGGAPSGGQGRHASGVDNLEALAITTISEIAKACSNLGYATKFKQWCDTNLDVSNSRLDITRSIDEPTLDSSIVALPGTRHIGVNPQIRDAYKLALATLSNNAPLGMNSKDIDDMAEGGRTECEMLFAVPMAYLAVYFRDPSCDTSQTRVWKEDLLSLTKKADAAIAAQGGGTSAGSALREEHELRHKKSEAHWESADLRRVWADSAFKDGEPWGNTLSLSDSDAYKNQILSNTERMIQAHDISEGEAISYISMQVALVTHTLETARGMKSRGDHKGAMERCEKLADTLGLPDKVYDIWNNDVPHSHKGDSNALSIDKFLVLFRTGGVKLYTATRPGNNLNDQLRAAKTKDNVIAALESVMASSDDAAVFMTMSAHSNAVRHPVDYILFTPHMRWTTGGVAMLTSGAQTGVLLYNNPNFQPGTDPNIKVSMAHFTVNLKALVLRPESVAFAPGVFPVSYEGGANANYFDPLNEEHVREYHQLNPGNRDIFVVPVPMNWRPSSSVMDITGKFDLSSVDDNGATHHPLGGILAQHWNFRSPNSAQQAGACQDAIQSRLNTVCLQGWSRFSQVGPDGNRTFGEVQSKSVRGPFTYSGAAKVRRGLGTAYQPSTISGEHFRGLPLNVARS